MTTIDEVKPFPELAGNVFKTCYFYDYRLYRHGLYKQILKEKQKEIEGLSIHQIEGIRTMIKIEQIVNAVFYCEDLALVLKAFQDDPNKYLSHIISIRENWIPPFWEEIKNKDDEYFEKLIGLDRITMTDEEKQLCVDSIPILKRDMTLIGSYFNDYYKFSTNFKHGLLYIPTVLESKEEKKHIIESIVAEVAENNLFNLLKIDASPVQNNTECTVFLVNNIFKHIVEALIVNQFLTPEEQEQTNFDKKYTISEETEGSIVSVQPVSFRKHSGKRVLPVYKALPNMKII